MSLRVYSEINLHITWHVKDNEPILKDVIEAQAHRFIRGRAYDTPGVLFHEVGGTDDHVHLVVSVQPTVPICEWVGRVKGGCSHFINHEIANRKTLGWQTGFGVVCFGTSDLPWVKRYVRDQRRRHATGRTEPRLERTEPDEESNGPRPG